MKKILFTSAFLLLTGLAVNAQSTTPEKQTAVPTSASTEPAAPAPKSGSCCSSKSKSGMACCDSEKQSAGNCSKKAARRNKKSNAPVNTQ
ncbi:MAG TPA: hypothetical protein VFW78_10140 [Bacteroidia bacterium]|nr:hypothetical protein [Bacteroidia bacterium]